MDSARLGDLSASLMQGVVVNISKIALIVRIGVMPRSTSTTHKQLSTLLGMSLNKGGYHVRKV